MSHYYQTDAIALRRRDLRESDRNISFYTENFGKVRAIVAGARKPKSKLSGHLEPFGIVSIGIARGVRNNRVTSALLIQRFRNISQDIELLFSAGFCLKLIDALIKEDNSDKRIFHLLKDSLEILDSDQKNKNIIIFNAVFTLKLMSLLGYKPRLHECALCSRKIKPSGNIFSFPKGGLICLDCKKEKSVEGVQVSDEDIKILRLALELSFIDIIKIKAQEKSYKKFNTIISGFFTFYMK